MPATPATYAEVEEEFVERILGLDASAYKQGGSKPKWRESSTPLTVLQDASSLAHLLVSVWIQSAPNTDLESDAYEDGFVWVECRMKVAFTYRLRASKQTKDARTATNAAIDVTRVVMAQPDANRGCTLVRLVDGLQPSISLDGEYTLIVQDYTVAFDLRLDPTPTTSPP